MRPINRRQAETQQTDYTAKMPNYQYGEYTTY